MAALLLAVALGYALGAVPSGVLVARLLGVAALHHAGSTHTGGTNVARVTGKAWAGGVTVLLDMGLAALAVWGASRLSDSAWAAPLAGAAAVLGHNWSAYIGFRGGIGLSTIIGALLAQAPWQTAILVLVCVAVWWGLRAVLHHSARSTILALCLVPVVFCFLRQPTPLMVGGGIAAGLAALKSLPDWNRRYETSQPSGR